MENAVCAKKRKKKKDVISLILDGTRFQIRLFTR